MAKPAKPAAPKKEDAAVAAAPAGNKKLIIIIAVLAAIIAGGAGWFFLKGNDAGHAEEAKVEAPKEPKFIPLEAFTVNLQREEADQFLQVTLSLKILDPELELQIKALLPEIRSKLNLLLSGKRPSEIATVEGKKKLAAEIATETNNVLGIHNGPDAHAAAPDGHAAASDAATPAPEHGTAAGHAEGEAPAAQEHAATEGPADKQEHTDVAAEGEAASAPDAAAPAHPAPVAGAEKKGVVDVLFTSFIIQ